MGCQQKICHNQPVPKYFVYNKITVWMLFICRCSNSSSLIIITVTMLIFRCNHRMMYVMFCYCALDIFILATISPSYKVLTHMFLVCTVFLFFFCEGESMGFHISISIDTHTPNLKTELLNIKIKMYYK